MKANRVEWLFLICSVVITLLAWFGYASTVNTVNVGGQFLMVACAVIGSFGLMLNGTLLYMIGFEKGKKKASKQTMIDG